MLSKIAVRNVKRQVGSYLIYFITIVITVALIFAVNNVVYSRELLAQSEIIGELKSGITAITVLIGAIVVFVLGYATSFMIRLRKREFGTYLTLGMTRKNILTIFFIETLIMFAAALLVGTLLGLVLYQGLMALLLALMDIPLALASYSFKGLMLTVAIVSAIFFLSSLAAALYLRKVSVIELLHGDKKVDKQVKHPFVWLAVAVLSLAVLVFSVFMIDYSIKSALEGKNGGMGLFWFIVLIALFVILLHISASKSIVALLLKNKRFAARGTNTFTLKQIGAKLQTNSIMMGLLAFLITFAVIGSNLSFAQKATVEESLMHNYPFDISASFEKGEAPKYDFEQAEAIIGQYVKIEDKQSYAVYEGDDNYLHTFTRFSGDNYEGLKDSFITLGDFNRLMNLIGKKPIELNGEFAVIENIGALNADFSAASLKLNGKSYKFKSIISDGRYFNYTYFVAVVPDDAVAGLGTAKTCRAYKLADTAFDAAALQQALTYTVDMGQYEMAQCDFNIRESARADTYGQAAIFILAALYIAIVFVFMAMALLALKTLSELAEDKRKYAILSRLGASGGALRKTLFNQIFSFFILPFLVPLLFSIPSGIVCYRLMAMIGFAGGVSGIVLITLSVALIMSAIYLLYFTATYSIAKKNILPDCG